VSDAPKLLRVLAGEAVSPPPIWIMRQAGRYLPEYRETRKNAGSFLDLCFTPRLAAEVTLQPIRRFDFDAAILFSDILVVPYGLGQGVRFVEGVGPRLDPLPGDLEALDRSGLLERLSPVLQAMKLVRRELSSDKALIGFCGAPWTVATYMIAGRGTPDQLHARRMAVEEPERLAALISLLVEVSAEYLVAQLRAGADAVKIFDSWAGILDDEGFLAWAVEPVRQIIGLVREAVPQARIIAFPKGAGARIADYAEHCRPDAVAVDWTVPMKKAREWVDPQIALQGNLDPLRLVVGGRALDSAVDAILSDMAGRAHVFNLGHGITPDTPVEHVAQLVERVRRRSAG
jgi:uroporphyrinogen decarboxylase